MAYARHLRDWGAVVVAALLVVLLLGAEAAQTILHPPHFGQIPSDSQNSALPAARRSLQPILDFLPFGEVQGVEAVQPTPNSPPAEPSVATLVLRGVFVAGDPALSRAMLGVDGGAAQQFAVGQTLPGGGTLTRIEPDKVWIDKDGDEQTLSFPHQTTADAALGVSGGSSEATASNPLPIMPQLNP